MSVSSVVLSLLLFGLLPRSTRGAPLALRSGAGEKLWETLHSLTRNPWEKRETGQDRDYLTGIKRLRRLYCNVGIGFHLQVLPDGKINGIHSENLFSLLEISPVDRGVVTLFSIHSGLFVAMNSKGKLYGSRHYNSECRFRETLLANNYNAYESAAYPAMYMALSKSGRAKRGNRVTPVMTVTHFLPRM